MLFPEFMPKRQLTSSFIVYPGIFGGGAETEILTIDFSASSKLLINTKLFIQSIDKYLVCGRMNSGTINTYANTTAFIAVLSSDLQIKQLKIFTFNNVTGEQTYAAA